MSKPFESLREYRRNTASYWLRSARKSFKAAKEMDSRGDDTFSRMAMKEMRLYADWKAKAERAEW